MVFVITGRQTLARTAWGENRGGGAAGMQSVINVICNRVAARWKGDGNVVAVCLRHDAEGTYQFSCWSPKDKNYPKLIDPKLDDDEFTIALALADRALAGDLPDITDGATNYHAASMREFPYWAKGKTPCARIAGQLFYRNA